MNIDWFTFAAQIINFLILVVLLRWFLYGPVVRAMETRQEKIASELKLAEESKRESLLRSEEFERRRRELDEQRESLMLRARNESEEQRKRLTREAQEAIQRRRAEWLQAFDREKNEVLDELRLHIGQLSAKGARRVLLELADETLESRIFKTFIHRLRTVDSAQKTTISSFLQDGTDLVSVRTAFPLSEENRALLRDTIREQFGYTGDIEFETSHELICGVEFNAGGYGFSWNVEEFMRGIEEEFKQRLNVVHRA